MLVATQVGALVANSMLQDGEKYAICDADSVNTTEGSCISDNEVSTCNDSQSDKQSDQVKSLFVPGVCSRLAALRGAGNEVLEKMCEQPPQAQQSRSTLKKKRYANKHQFTIQAPLPTSPGLDWLNAKSQDCSSDSKHEEALGNGAGNEALEKMSEEPTSQPQQRRSTLKSKRNADKQQPIIQAPLPTSPGLDWLNAKSQDCSSDSKHEEALGNALKPVKVRGTGDSQFTSNLCSMSPMKKKPLCGFVIQTGSLDPTQPVKKRVTEFLMKEPSIVLTC